MSRTHESVWIGLGRNRRTRPMSRKGERSDGEYGDIEWLGWRGFFDVSAGVFGVAVYVIRKGLDIDSSTLGASTASASASASAANSLDVLGWERLRGCDAIYLSRCKVRQARAMIATCTKALYL